MSEGTGSEGRGHCEGPGVRNREGPPVECSALLWAPQLPHASVPIHDGRTLRSQALPSLHHGQAAPTVSYSRRCAQVCAPAWVSPVTEG